MPRTPNDSHGHSLAGKHSPTYVSWKSMIQRCTNPKNKCSAIYGGRGIQVCERWKGAGGFKNFLSDMGTRPDGMSLDRMDSNQHYTPDNCRWATPVEQGRNTRRTKLDVGKVQEIRGRHDHGESYASIAARFGVTPENIGIVVRRKAWANVP